MEVIEGPMQIETLTEQAPTASQPATPQTPIAPANALDDAAVRAAIAKAESEGISPESLTLADLSQGNPPKAETSESVPAKPNAEKPVVPEKFLKPDGEVDVEKLKASTEQLREAVQDKEQKIQKSVEDYIAEYRALEKRMSSSPNPDKLAANMPPPPPPPPSPPQMSDEELRKRLAEDFQRDFVGTTTDLIDVIVRRKLEERLKPFEEPIKSIEAERRENKVRENLKRLASEDPRITEPSIFKAINDKLQSEPELWNLKNPYRAAYLEVKEELRLGEPVKQVQAQPSRLPSPILGGGTPPSTPSAPVATDPRTILSSIDKLDPRDKKQEAIGDAAIRALFKGR